MKPLGLSMNKFALDLRVPVTRIAEIVYERRAISTDTPPRLGRYFNTTPVFWMNLQVLYDLEAAEEWAQHDSPRAPRVSPCRYPRQTGRHLPALFCSTSVGV